MPNGQKVLMQLKVTKATKSALIVETGFGAYDLCINPYVGCQFGCTYCYVRFFVKDEERPWGEFVRTRDHIKTKLPFELRKLAGKRLVIGTMTDPYQPQEQKAGLTRMILEMIANSEHKPASIGLFTRSPLVRRDLELLKKLNVRVHLTITPFSADVLRLIEPIPVRTNARFELDLQPARRSTSSDEAKDRVAASTIQLAR
jgi:DNA repair photolyase